MLSKSTEFNDVLDECLERLLVKGETVEQCLGRFPEYAEGLKPLLETALVTKQAAAIQLRAEFREQARHRFYSALQGMENKKHRFLLSWRWQPRWATVVAILLVLSLAGSGTVMAASGSMPDEPLYPVKLVTEQARLVLTPSALGKAELYTELADRRVGEIVHMVGKNKPERIERTTRRLDGYLGEIARLASTQEVTGQGKMLATEDLRDIRKEPLAPGTPEYRGRAGVGADRRAQSGGIMRRWAGAGIEGDHRAEFREMMRQRAASHSDRLRALLKTVPEPARPALLRAIAVSETGYQKALESLDWPPGGE